MLSTAVKHLKTCSSLRNNRNYVAHLSIANPKDLRLFTRRQAKEWLFTSDLTAPNHKSVRQPIQCFKKHFTCGKWSFPKQESLNYFQACGRLPQFSGKFMKNSEHACLSQIVTPMWSSPKSHSYLLLLSFDSLHCVCRISFEVWLSIAWISTLRESKNGFDIKKKKQPKKKQKRFSILKISGKGSNWASVRVISKRVFVSFSSAHCSSQWTGRPWPNQQVC